MSAEAQTQQLPDFAAPTSSLRPNILVTGTVSGIEDAITTGNGDGYYDKAKINFTPTRRSRKFSGSIMFRPEMFSLGSFNPTEHYGHYEEDGSFTPSKMASQVVETSSGAHKPLGQSFLGVYNMNIAPKMKTKKVNGVNTTIGISQQTPLSYIAGGTVEGFNTLRAALVEALGQVPSDRDLCEFGFKTLTSQEIIEVLRLVAKANPQEQVFELKQQFDFQTGAPTDFYEITRAYGPLTPELHAKLEAKVAETASLSGSKKVVRSYSAA